MKLLYFLLGIIIGGSIVFIYACLSMQRPNCFDWQYMEKDFTGEYVCKDKV